MGGLISRIFRRKTTDDESRPKSKKGRRFGSFRRPKSEEPQTSIHQSRCNTLPSRTPISQIENGQTIEREEARRKTMQEIQNSTGTSSQLSGFTGETTQIPCAGKQDSEQNLAQNQLDLSEQAEDVNAERCAAVKAVSLSSKAPNQNNHQPPIGNIQTLWMTEQDDMVQVQLEENGETAFVIPDKAEIAQLATEFQNNTSQSRCQRKSVAHDTNTKDTEDTVKFEAESVNVEEPIIPEYPAEVQQRNFPLQTQPEETTENDHGVHDHTHQHVRATSNVSVGEEDVEVPAELQHETPTHETQPEWTTEHEDGMHLESDARVGTTSAIAGDAQIAQLPSGLEDEIAIGDAQPVLATEYEDTVHAVSESHAEATPAVPVWEEDVEVPAELQHETPTHETQPEWTTEHEDGMHLESDARVGTTSAIAGDAQIAQLPSGLEDEIAIGDAQPVLATEYEDTVHAVSESHAEATPAVPVWEEDVEVPAELQHETPTHETQPEWTTEHEDGMHLESDARVGTTSAIAGDAQIAQLPSGLEDEIAIGDAQPVLATEYEDTVHAVSESHAEATPAVPVWEEDVEVPAELQHETPTHETQPEWTTEHEDGMHLESDARVGTTSAIAGDAQIAQLPSGLEDEIAIGDAQPVLATEYEDTVHAVSESHAEATPAVPVWEEDVEVPAELQHETPTHEIQPDSTVVHEYAAHTSAPSVIPDGVVTADFLSAVCDDRSPSNTQSHICLEETESTCFTEERALRDDDADMGYFERNAIVSPPDLIAHHDGDADLGDGELQTPSASDISEHAAASFAQPVSSLHAVPVTCPENIPSTVNDALDKIIPAAPVSTTVSESPPTRLLDGGESQAEATDEAKENMCGDQNSLMRHMASIPDELVMGTTLVSGYQPCSSDSLTDEDRIPKNASFVHSVIQGTASADDSIASQGSTNKVLPEVENEAASDTNLSTGFEQGAPTTSDLVAHSLVADILDHAACSVSDNTADSDLQITGEYVYNDGDSTLLDNRESTKLQLNGNCSPSLNGTVHENISDKEHCEVGVITTTTKQTDLPSTPESFDITADAMPQESAPNLADA
ncbi:uncharacterized protein DEA37_0007616 [Paragonimus westermani]|uniref:Uncharacterized protein n=1 Tax=Paragonimus westermani TaxID=34504 RepID=A0A5J4NIU6_9TREM|nr:uncharacterized protein DEA37_0007616 [Paragonimus westermani]